jgi:hypothetical protein
MTNKLSYYKNKELDYEDRYNLMEDVTKLLNKTNVHYKWVEEMIVIYAKNNEENCKLFNIEENRESIYEEEYYLNFIDINKEDINDWSDMELLFKSVKNKKAKFKEENLDNWTNFFNKKKINNNNKKQVNNS